MGTEWGEAKDQRVKKCVAELGRYKLVLAESQKI